MTYFQTDSGRAGGAEIAWEEARDGGARLKGMIRWTGGIQPTFGDGSAANPSPIPCFGDGFVADPSPNANCKLQAKHLRHWETENPSRTSRLTTHVRRRLQLTSGNWDPISRTWDWKPSPDFR